MRISKYRLHGLMLITTVVAVAAWILLAGGIFLTQSSQFQMLGASKMEEQARQYAEVDANLLQLIEYGKLTDSSTLASYKLHTNRAQIQAVDAPDWEDAISIGSEQMASSGGAYRVATIDIYRKGDTEPRVSLNVPIVKDAQMYSRSQLDKMIADATAQAKAAAEAAKKAAEEAAKNNEEKESQEEIKYIAYGIFAPVFYEYMIWGDQESVFRFFVYDIKTHELIKTCYVNINIDCSPAIHVSRGSYNGGLPTSSTVDLSFFKTQYAIRAHELNTSIKKQLPANTDFKILYDRYTITINPTSPLPPWISSNPYPIDKILSSSGACNYDLLYRDRFKVEPTSYSGVIWTNGYPPYSFW